MTTKNKILMYVVIFLNISLIAGFVYYTKGTNDYIKNVIVINIWVVVLAVQVLILGYLFYKISTFFKSK